MTIDFLTEARALSDELSALRQAFHRAPELGNREYETAARIESTLASWGIETRRLLDTAVVGTLRGGRPGRAVALRADMDALPITEATGVDFASRNPGVMHACGHDVHVTAALGAARLLANHRDALPGRAVFLFQPDEEGNGGARRLIEAGALDGVAAVFGAHVSPDLPAGVAGFRPGKFYAASATFRIAVTGRSAHGAERERGVDALGAAAELVGAALSLPREWPNERCVVTVGTFHAGAAVNILADRAELSGIIRTLGPELRTQVCAALERRAAEIAARWGAQVDCAIRTSYPGVVNDPAMTAFARETAAALLGRDAVRDIAEPTMTTEDFGEYLAQCPGAFYHIGAGCAQPLHSSGFLPDARILPAAAALHAAVLARFLGLD